MMTTNFNRTGARSLSADSKNYLEDKDHMKEDHAPHEAFSRWNRLVREERERQARKVKDQAESGGRKK